MHYIQALFIARIGLYEEQIFTNGTGEKLRILRNEANSFAQGIHCNLILCYAVIKDVTALRAIETHQQFHQRGLAGAGRPDEGNRFTASNLKADTAQGGR